MAHDAFEGDNRAIQDDYLIRQRWVHRVDGEVKEFTCNHIRSQAKRGLKFYKRDSLSSEQYQGIVNGVKVLQQIDHPNIVKVFDTYIDEKRIYIVYEHLEGLDLIESVHKFKRFDETGAAKIMHQLLKAMNYCHEQNIVHRDLKPENIILVKNADGDYVIKLINFDQAVVYDSQPKLETNRASIYEKGDDSFRDKGGLLSAENLKKTFESRQDI